MSYCCHTPICVIPVSGSVGTGVVEGDGYWGCSSHNTGRVNDATGAAGVRYLIITTPLPPAYRGDTDGALAPPPPLLLQGRLPRMSQR